jgi:hypothetical protein
VKGDRTVIAKSVYTLGSDLPNCTQWYVWGPSANVSRRADLSGWCWTFSVSFYIRSISWKFTLKQDDGDPYIEIYCICCIVLHRQHVSTLSRGHRQAIEGFIKNHKVYAYLIQATYFDPLKGSISGHRRIYKKS